MRYSLFILFLVQVLISTAQIETRVYYDDEGLIPRERSVDFTHLKLEVAFNPAQKLVKGKVTEDFIVLQEEIDTLFLDAIKMRFNRVLLNGKTVDYKTSDLGITIVFKEKLKWNEQHQIQIEYEANPKKGLYFIGWDDKTNKSRKQIWTQGQGIDNRNWIPMYDERNDKLVTELKVTFDEKYEVLSNGVLLESKSLKGSQSKVWHYKISHPHSPYLMMLGIGEYAIKVDTSTSGVPMHLYYYPGQEEQFEPTYRLSKEMFDFFELEIGVAYPWETYAQIPVQDFMYGAMENTTATIFGDFYLVDSNAFLDRNYIRVNAHELAHQWFGDMVTARSSAHHWLQESFATHYDLMYQGEAFGKDHFDWLRRNYNNQSIAASKRDLKPIAHSAGGTVRHYPKGAYVLQMLKYVVGRNQFNAVIKYYLEKHEYGNVDSDDLLTAFHERLGLSLNWFWEQWVYKGGEPHYEVGFKKKKGKGIFRVEQIQKQEDLSGNFKMPIWFEVHFEDGTVDRKKVWIEADTTEVEFDLEKKKVAYTLFDPNSEIMKQLSFTKSVKELKNQASSANMIDRYNAYLALDTLKFNGKEEFLKARYKVETFHGIKANLVKQLTEEGSKSIDEILSLAIQDKSAEVRKAGLKYTRKVSPEMEKEYMTLLDDDSYQVAATALEILSISKLDNAKIYLEATKKLKGNRSHNIRITWLKIAAITYSDEAYLKELIMYASPSYEFLTRSNAMNALVDLQYLNEELLDYLMEAKFHFNSRVRRSAHNTIEYFSKHEQYSSLVSEYINSRIWTERKRKALERYLTD
ncbi:MAG: M1 family metallopeptidase [Flavobacteriales bacterium]|nr:M1 family metallopeptidase [Flavobacteriales bacterium]